MSEEKQKEKSEVSETPADSKATTKSTKPKQPRKSAAGKKTPRPRKTTPKKSAPKKTTAESVDTAAKSEETKKKGHIKSQPKSGSGKRPPRPRKAPPKKSVKKTTAAAASADSVTKSETVEKKTKTKPQEKSSPASEAKSSQQKSAPKKPGKGPRPPAKRTTKKISPKAKEQTPKQESGNRKPGTQKATTKTSRSPAKKSVEKGPSKKQDTASIKLLINADEPEEARIVLLVNGKVESFHIETVSVAQSKGNIYKGRISSIEPNLQSVFVDLGTEKNGFLPFSEIHPEYYCKEVPPGTHWKRLDILEVLKKGQEILVQVVKEATGNKGASVTTYLSMPGRYVVLMPGSDSHGISRQITDEPRRSKLREILDSAKLPEEIGYIIRTASRDVTKTAMVKDIRYQMNLWKEIKNRGQTLPTPSLIYKEQDVTSRFLRDHFNPDITEILVDNRETFNQVENFLSLLPARQRKTKVKLHQGARPIFNLYQVEEQIEQMFQPEVKLPSGGSIVINPTEALVAVDVNSGRTSKDKNFEETIFLVNMEAAEELARQLRLRDLGGLIVVDFIDMRDKKHVREVEKKMKSSMKRDKAKNDSTRISKFGLMQISRQRLGPPIQKGSYIICKHCQGLGMTRSVETMALSHLRKIQTGAIKKLTGKVICRFPSAIAQYLLNQKRGDILALENKYKVQIQIEADAAMSPAQSSIEFEKNNLPKQ